MRLTCSLLAVRHLSVDRCSHVEAFHRRIYSLRCREELKGVKAELLSLTNPEQLAEKEAELARAEEQRRRAEEEKK